MRHYSPSLLHVIDPIRSQHVSFINPILTAAPLKNISHALNIYNTNVWFNCSDRIQKHNVFRHLNQDRLPYDCPKDLIWSFKLKYFWVPSYVFYFSKLFWTFVETSTRAPPTSGKKNTRSVAECFRTRNTKVQMTKLCVYTVSLEFFSKLNYSFFLFTLFATQRKLTMSPIEH